MEVPHVHIKRVQCFARGVDGDWEAICPDLDIAVQGESFEHVRRLLNDSVETYIADVLQEAPRERARLLNRRAPLHVRLGLALGFLVHSLRRDGDDYRAGFDLPCPA